MGFLETATTPWGVVSKAMRLIVDDVDVVAMSDMAYVSSGYAPLSARLVEAAEAAGGSWAGVPKAVLDVVPGPALRFAQAPTPEPLAAAVKRAARAPPPPPRRRPDEAGADAQDRPVLMVYFVGGVSHLELAALRHLSDSGKCAHRIVVATTRVMTGEALVESLLSEVGEGRSRAE